jgi:HAD superfamily hydrolase (TIGR01549 family)
MVMAADVMMLPRAVLFDMDGTLTVPLLDFPRLKAEMTIGNQPILETLEKLEGTRRQEAERVLHRHEHTAAEQSTLNPGCLELLGWLAERKIGAGLVTRNSRDCAQTIIRRHRLTLDVVITREDCPYKPDPAPLRLACQRLGVPGELTWMVGDGLYDIQAGLAAGIPTVWLSHGRQRDFDAQPWRVVTDLHELGQLLRSAR